LLTTDKLSAFFVLVINITTLVSSIYSIQYMSMYHTKSRPELFLHYFSFFTLYWSIIILTMLQNTIAFLVVWKIMSLSSFLLVMFEVKKSATQKAGINILFKCTLLYFSNNRYYCFTLFYRFVVMVGIAAIFC